MFSIAFGIRFGNFSFFVFRFSFRFCFLLFVFRFSFRFYFCFSFFVSFLLFAFRFSVFVFTLSACRIGPQQQDQPGTPGNGCSFRYPLVPVCPTQPRVSVSNIVLENINFAEGDTLPGVLLCNETNPCSGFVFNNVKNKGNFLVQSNYVCQNTIASFIDSDPVPDCIN
jgi:hypothetical protein